MRAPPICRSSANRQPGRAFRMRSGRSVRTLAVGTGVAMVIAFTMAVPIVGTLSTWKIVLGVVGLVIFFRAGRG